MLFRGKPRLVGALAAIVTLGACSNGSGPGTLTLDNVTDPDTNLAVVVLDRDVVEGTDTVKAGVEEPYLVVTGDAPGTLEAYAGVKSVTFTVGDPYTATRLLTDGSTNTFEWIGPTGRAYFPVTKCAITIRSAFVADTASTLWLETACPVAPLDGGGSVTVLVKARRVDTPTTGP